MAIDVLEVVRFLALDTGNYVNLRQSRVKRVRSLIFQSIRILKARLAGCTQKFDSLRGGGLSDLRLSIVPPHPPFRVQHRRVE
jgi:hypothetical protein